MTQGQSSTLIPETLKGQRLDQALAKLFPNYSRALLQRWLKNGAILVNGKTLAAKTKITGGEQLTIEIPEETRTKDSAQEHPLSIVYEDEYLLVLNKPAGWVVHPGAGNHDHTVLNALLFHAPTLSKLPRAGIVHRLDKDTSGLMVVAKTVEAQLALTEQLQSRTVHREYEAIVIGSLISGLTIDLPIYRDTVRRTQMSVAPEGKGKPAITHVRIIERYPQHTRVRVNIETGRTHQIRVHLHHIGSPILGDPVYGKRLSFPKQASAELTEKIRLLKRQALHATQLSFVHPSHGKICRFEAPPPEDMSVLYRLFSALNQSH